MPILNELKLAKELMSFPSITPVDAGTMNFLARKLRSLGFKCKILEFKSKNSKPVKNLYARLGKSRPNFCYAGHTDVVPPGNLNDWTVNPFKPAVKGNHLIGRGANDMKASVACFVAAVSKFKSKKFIGSISLLITGDEEGIAINGTKRVVEYLKRKKEKIDFCLVGEPTNQNKLGEMMKIGRRGSITGYLTVYGIQGHVAYPHDANNPAPVMTKILNEISIDFEFSIVGGGDTHKLDKQYLENKKFVFYPFQNEINSLIKFYDNHNITILPSFTEAYPKVVDESLSRLRPVIVFEEISHIIQDRQGLFITKRNAQSLSETIEFIMSNYSDIQEDMKKNKLPTKREFFSQMVKILG